MFQFVKSKIFPALSIIGLFVITFFFGMMMSKKDQKILDEKIKAEKEKLKGKIKEKQNEAKIKEAKNEQDVKDALTGTLLDDYEHRMRDQKRGISNRR